MKASIEKVNYERVNNSYICTIDVNIKVDGHIVFSHSFIGKSNCHPEDAFDDIKGKRIAESKAKIKLFKFMKNHTKKLYNRVFEELNKYESAMNKYTDAYYKEVVHVEELDM